MSYIRSSPRVNFHECINGILNRVRLAAQKDVPVDLREYVHACSIFLSHAEFENYFTDILEKIAILYSTQSGGNNFLPLSLRAHVFLSRSNLWRSIANWLADGNEQSLIKGAATALNNHVPTFLESTAPPLPLTGKDILGPLTYPSARNIQQVLRRLGIGDPEGSVNRIAKTDAWLLLKSISDLRTSLAHDASLPGLSRKDLVDRLRGLERFVRAMDRVLYLHIRSTHHDGAWASAMTKRR